MQHAYRLFPFGQSHSVPSLSICVDVRVSSKAVSFASGVVNFLTSFGLSSFPPQNPSAPVLLSALIFAVP